MEPRRPRRDENIIQKTYKKIALYSHIDLDGLSALLLGKLQHQIKFEHYQTFNYDTVTPELISQMEEYTDIYITDITIPYEEMNHLLDLGRTIHLFDHHESSFETSEKDGVEQIGLKYIDHPNFHYTYTDEKCGTKIFYEYLLKNKYIKQTNQLDYFVKLVDLYDRFVSNDDLFVEAENLNRCFWKLQAFFGKGMRRYSEFLIDFEKKLTRDVPFEFNPYELEKIEIVIKQENEYTKKALKNMQVRVDEKGTSFGVIELSSKVSKVCSNILKERDDLEYLVAINTYSEYKMSLRSREGFDLLQLVGCKGHKAASGTDHKLYSPGFCRRFLKRNMTLKYLPVDNPT